MIRKDYRKFKKYCCEDLSLIENYQEAVNSPEKWDCHHRLEIDLNKRAIELMELGLYWNRPASELVFMTHKDHCALHAGIIHKGKIVLEESKRKMSESMKGRTAWNKGGTPKYKYLTPTGEIKMMDVCNASRYHPDWKKL